MPPRVAPARVAPPPVEEPVEDSAEAVAEDAAANDDAPQDDVDDRTIVSQVKKPTVNAKGVVNGYLYEVTFSDGTVEEHHPPKSRLSSKDNPRYNWERAAVNMRGIEARSKMAMHRGDPTKAFTRPVFHRCVTACKPYLLRKYNQQFSDAEGNLLPLEKNPVRIVDRSGPKPVYKEVPFSEVTISNDAVAMAFMALEIVEGDILSHNRLPEDLKGGVRDARLEAHGLLLLQAEYHTQRNHRPFGIDVGPHFDHLFAARKAKFSTSYRALNKNRRPAKQRSEAQVLSRIAKHILGVNHDQSLLERALVTVYGDVQRGVKVPPAPRFALTKEQKILQDIACKELDEKNEFRVKVGLKPKPVPVTAPPAPVAVPVAVAPAATTTTNKRKAPPVAPATAPAAAAAPARGRPGPKKATPAAAAVDEAPAAAAAAPPATKKRATVASTAAAPAARGGRRPPAVLAAPAPDLPDQAMGEDDVPQEGAEDPQ